MDIDNKESNRWTLDAKDAGANVFLDETQHQSYDDSLYGIIILWPIGASGPSWLIVPGGLL